MLFVSRYVPGDFGFSGDAPRDLMFAFSGFLLFQSAAGGMVLFGAVSNARFRSFWEHVTVINEDLEQFTFDRRSCYLRS